MSNLSITNLTYNNDSINIDTQTDTDTKNIFSTIYDKNFYPDQTTYYYFKNTFSENECNSIINAFSPICDNVGVTFSDDPEYRKSLITWIPYNDTTKWIYDRILDCAKTANNETYLFDITTICEKIQFSCYNGSNGDKYDKHIDLGGNSLFSCRKLSITVQLSKSDDYTGGNVNIRNYKIPRDQGSLTTFPSFLEHNVDPVVEGKRYSLVIWLYGPHFR